MGIEIKFLDHPNFIGLTERQCGMYKLMVKDLQDYRRNYVNNNSTMLITIYYMS